MAGVRLGKVPAVASHELDHQIAVLLRVVSAGEKIAIASVESNINMEVAVGLVTDERHPSLGPSAWIEKAKAAWVIDASQHTVAWGTARHARCTRLICHTPRRLCLRRTCG